VYDKALNIVKKGDNMKENLSLPKKRAVWFLFKISWHCLQRDVKFSSLVSTKMWYAVKSAYEYNPAYNKKKDARIDISKVWVGLEEE